MRHNLPLFAVIGLIALASSAADAQYYPYSYYSGSSSYVSTTVRSSTLTVNPGMHALGDQGPKSLRAQPRIDQQRFFARSSVRPARAASAGCTSAVTGPLLEKSTSGIALSASEASAFRRCFGRDVSR
jgi:hypothetical protein